MKKFVIGALCALSVQAAFAVPITDPDDARNWQGATVGTFAQLYYGADNAVNRQLAVDNNLLDDGIFNSSGFSAATLIAGGATAGFSVPVSGNPYNYGIGGSVSTAANSIDNLWFQSNGVVGHRSSTLAPFTKP